MDKLEQKVVDFDKIEQENVKEGNWDVVYITCVYGLCGYLTMLLISVVRL